MLWLKNNWELIGIILLGFVLRIIFLSRGDMLSDEVLYAFRSIGLTDFVFSDIQPGMMQLFNGATIPWWAHLSFHDHPLTVFITQYLSMKAFGISSWAARLPSALLSTASLYFVYSISQKLFSREVGLLAALFGSVQILLVYTGRTAMQESAVIFCILVVVWMYLKSQEQKKWFMGTGVMYGVAILTKYVTSFIILPLIFHYSIYGNKHKKVKKYVCIGIALAIVVMLPVIIFNIGLQHTFGHFDFQLSHILGQNVSYWQVTPGKEIGSLWHRFVGIGSVLWNYGSRIFLYASIVGMIGMAVVWFRDRKNEHTSAYALFWYIVIAHLLWYVVIGSSVRFMTLLAPWLVIAIAYSTIWTYKNIQSHLSRTVLVTGMVVFCIWEVWFTVNSYICYQPMGNEGWGYSRIHWDMHPWGYNELNGDVATLYEGAYPERTIPYNNTHLTEIRSRAVDQALSEAKEPKNILIIYDNRMSEFAMLWVFNRRGLYDSWPVIASSDVSKFGSEPFESFKEGGFTEAYIYMIQGDVLKRTFNLNPSASELLQTYLDENDIPFETIYNNQGREAFKRYHITF